MMNPNLSDLVCGTANGTVNGAANGTNGTVIDTLDENLFNCTVSEIDIELNNLYTKKANYVTMNSNSSWVTDIDSNNPPQYNNINCLEHGFLLNSNGMYTVSNIQNTNSEYNTSYGCMRVMCDMLNNCTGFGLQNQIDNERLGYLNKEGDSSGSSESYDSFYKPKILILFGDYVTFDVDDGVYTLNNDIKLPYNIDLSLADLNGYTFDGNNKTITYNGTDDWEGLFQPATNVTVTIQNINFTLGDSASIAEYCGGIIGEGAHDDYKNSEVTIDNCHVNADVSEFYSGGIVGNYFGSDSDNCTITNCSTTGTISGESAGGICGQYAGYSGKVTISDCYTEGDISGDYAGGICGDSAGFVDGNVYIYNCYTEGEISGEGAGGICGIYVVNAKVDNCYTEGEISGKQAGGICGETAGGDGGNMTISNCYTKGNVSGKDAGGICGRYAGYNVEGGLSEYQIVILQEILQC